MEHYILRMHMVDTVWVSHRTQTCVCVSLIYAYLAEFPMAF